MILAQNVKFTHNDRESTTAAYQAGQHKQRKAAEEKERQEKAEKAKKYTLTANQKKDFQKYVDQGKSIAVVYEMKKGGGGAIVKIEMAPDKKDVGALVYLHPDKVDPNMKVGDIVIPSKLRSTKAIRVGCETFKETCQYGTTSVQIIS